MIWRHSERQSNSGYLFRTVPGFFAAWSFCLLTGDDAKGASNCRKAAGRRPELEGSVVGHPGKEELAPMDELGPE